MTSEISNISMGSGTIDREDYIGQFQSQQLAYTSITAETEEQRKALFNLMNTPDHRLADFINKTIALKDIYIEVVELAAKDASGAEITGEDGLPKFQKAPRIVLVDAKGKSYQCVSVGILGSLKKMQNVFGAFPWNPARNITVKQISKGAKQILSLEVL